MRNDVFVEGLSNVTRMLDAYKAVENRGSPEAGWQLVEGDPGYGKSRALYWMAFRKSPVFIRAKAHWTPNAMLHDFIDCLGLTHARSTHSLMNAVLGEIMLKQCPIFIDEIDHCARDVRVLETLRDITDISNVILVAGGMKGARGLIKRYPQIYSRIAEVVTFGPASVEDVKTMCRQLSEIEIAGDLAAEIQRRNQGVLRGVRNSIARIERVFRKQREAVTLEMWGSRALTKDDNVRPQLALVSDANG